MAKNKRKNAGLDYDEPSKRSRHDGPSKGATQGRVDPTYGQRSAFPGLDEYSAGAIEDEDLEYGDDVEALRYLHAVRSEAAGIPNVLVAPKRVPEGEEQDRSIYDGGLGDSRGFYSDGAYTAAPILSPSPTPSATPALRSPRDVYFEKILERFKTLRDQLSNIPPRHVVEHLSKDHTSYMSASAEDYRKWRWRISHTEPMTAQLAGMDKGTVLRLLRLVVNDKCALGGKVMLTAQLSRWIWGVLARLPERGELNSEEIGVVRDLGKRAVWVSVEMRGVDTSGLDDGRGEESEDGDIVLDVETHDSEEQPEDGCANKIEANKIERPFIGPVLPSTAVQTPEREVELHRDDGFYEEKEQVSSQAKLLADTHDASTPVDERTGDDTKELVMARERLLARLNGVADSGQSPSVTGEDAEEGEVHGEVRSEGGGMAVQQLHNARATIDMVITVAGEVYGQRDLLEFREEWD